MKRNFVCFAIAAMFAGGAGEARAQALFSPVRLSRPSGGEISAHQSLRAGDMKTGQAGGSAARPISTERTVAMEANEKPDVLPSFEAPAPMPEASGAKAKKTMEPVIEDLPEVKINYKSDQTGAKTETISAVNTSNQDFIGREVITFVRGDDSAGIGNTAKRVANDLRNYAGTYTIKLTSFYTGGARNIAFARLLNVRKELMDGGVSSANIMILVEESAEKADTVEIDVSK